MIARTINFIKAQDKDACKCLLMVHFKTSYLKLTPFRNLEQHYDIGRSLENPPKDSKTAGRYRASSS